MTVTGNKIAASLESRVREVGSFLFIVEQSTLQIFDNLQRSPKKSLRQTVLCNRADASIGSACDRLRAPVTVTERSSGNRAFTMLDEIGPCSADGAEDRSCHFPSPARP
jgi:hypothetical protein